VRCDCRPNQLHLRWNPPAVWSVVNPPILSLISPSIIDPLFFCFVFFFFVAAGARRGCRRPHLHAARAFSAELSNLGLLGCCSARKGNTNSGLTVVKTNPAVAHPGPPANPVPWQPDYHFPPSEPTERASLVRPTLESVDCAHNPPRAILKNPSTGESATVTRGDSKWGWTLLHVVAASTPSPSPNDGAASEVDVAHVVMEFAFDEWAEIAYISPSWPTPLTVRKPVGTLSKIVQPSCVHLFWLGCVVLVLARLAPFPRHPWRSLSNLSFFDSLFSRVVLQSACSHTVYRKVSFSESKRSHQDLATVHWAHPSVP
jgi:hypothetical protein